MRFRTILIVVLALLPLSCASPGGKTIDASEFACPQGLARPFSMETVLRIANENGVSLKRDPDCGANFEAIDSASNTNNGNDDDEVDAREGGILCAVIDLPLAAPPFRVDRVKYATDHETHVGVGNVSCSIYPTADGQIARLQTAFEALAKAPVEIRSCPKTHPAPVTVARLIKAGKKKGLHLLPDARCMEPGVVAQASTLIPYDEENADDLDILVNQGEVTCLVRATPARGAKAMRTTDLTVGKRFDFLNVSCTVRTSPEKEAVQVERVRATVEASGRR